MPMIAAAARAAFTCAASSTETACASIAASSVALRAATADASATPAICSARSPGDPASDNTVERLSFKSRAWSGIRVFKVVTSRLSPSRGLQRFVARLPVAGAELVRLQSIENAQHLVHVAADVHVGDGREPDHALWIDDERRAFGDAFRIEHTERAAQVFADVGEHRKRQAAQILVVLAPGQVNEFAVDGCAEHLSISIRELAGLAPELRDLGGAHECEILGPEEQHEPLARVRLVVDGRECGVQVLRHGGLQRKLRETVAYGQHVQSSMRHSLGSTQY